MDKENILAMDSNILVSLINMKIRDRYSNLDNFCEDINIEKEIILDKLSQAGFEYNNVQNQFR